MIEFGHGTHVGLRRTRNEDTYYADATLGLFLVADGMGGHQHGEVAAALVRDTVVELVTHQQDLVHAVQGATERLMASARNSADAIPTGSTIAALQLTDDGYTMAWVGDSRIYFWQKTLQQIRHDPALVHALVAAGKLDAALATRQAQPNVLNQALGVTASSQLRIGMARGRLSPGTSFLLCTDGLTEAVTDVEIGCIMQRTDLAPQECVDQLLLSALACGGDDNVTALIVRSS